MEKVGILLAMALVWLVVNVKAGHRWLEILSLGAMLFFLIGASVVALDLAGISDHG